MMGWLPLLRAATLGLTLLSLGAFAQQAPQGDGVREVQLAAGQFERGVPVPAWVEVFQDIPQTTDKSPLVGLLADTQLLASGRTSQYVHRIWQANEASALEQIGRYSIEFNPAYQQVQLHTLRVIRGGTALDRLASARITFLQRETGLEGGVYSGDVSASILIDDLRTGDLLEVVTTIHGENPVMGGKYLQSVSWDQSVPTELRRVTSLQPAGRKIGWKMVGDMAGAAVVPTETMVGPLRKLRWEGRNLRPPVVEKSLPADFLPYRYLQLSEFQSWSEVTAWADQLFKPDATDTPALAEAIARLKTLPTNAEKAAAALSLVQGEVRYFSLSLGESSHRPAAPGVTFGRRYGDCKDKSLLLIHLLQALGVPAQPVLVSARTHRGSSKLLPSPHAFDHAIVRAQVDGQDYFLDATRQGQAGKLAAMGQIWEDAEVLVVQPGNNTFTTIKSANYAAVSRNELNEKITVSQFGGSSEILSRQTWSGAAAESRRLIFSRVEKDVVNKVLIEPYEKRYPGAEYVVPPVLEDDVANNVLTLVMRIRSPQIAVRSGTSWAVRYGVNNMVGVLPAPPSATRMQPFALPLKGKLAYALEIEWPPEVASINDPVNLNVRDPAFDWSVTKTFRGNRSTARYTVDLLDNTVAARRVGAYMTAIRQATEKDPSLFAVGKEDIKSGGLLGLGRQTLKSSIEARVTDTIGKLGKTIEADRLGGEDLANTYCDRAESLAELGRLDDALKDAQQAIKISPSAGRSYGCRGNVLFAMGEYTRAISDYSKSLTLDEDAHVYYRRGHARYYAGQLAAAAEDFLRAGSTKDNEELQLYTELWRVWTLKRLGQPLSAEQRKLAAADPRGEWPRPALAMLHGMISVEDMLNSLNQKKGDEREMALVEGNFYAGQWYLLQGDKARASDFFQKTRDKGVVIYIEHTAAGIELQQLTAK